jgi:hypothetical protein
MAKPSARHRKSNKTQKGHSAAAAPAAAKKNGAISAGGSQKNSAASQFKRLLLEIGREQKAHEAAGAREISGRALDLATEAIDVAGAKISAFDEEWFTGIEGWALDAKDSEAKRGLSIFWSVALNQIVMSDGAAQGAGETDANDGAQIAQGAEAAPGWTHWGLFGHLESPAGLRVAGVEDVSAMERQLSLLAFGEEGRVRVDPVVFSAEDYFGVPGLDPMLGALDRMTNRKDPSQATNEETRGRIAEANLLLARREGAIRAKKAIAAELGESAGDGRISVGDWTEESLRAKNEALREGFVASVGAPGALAQESGKKPVIFRFALRGEPDAEKLSSAIKALGAGVGDQEFALSARLGEREAAMPLAFAPMSIALAGEAFNDYLHFDELLALRAFVEVASLSLTRQGKGAKITIEPTTRAPRDGEAAGNQNPDAVLWIYRVSVSPADKALANEIAGEEFGPFEDPREFAARAISELLESGHDAKDLAVAPPRRMTPEEERSDAARKKAYRHWSGRMVAVAVAEEAPAEPTSAEPAAAA